MTLIASDDDDDDDGGAPPTGATESSGGGGDGGVLGLVRFEPPTTMTVVPRQDRRATCVFATTKEEVVTTAAAAAAGVCSGSCLGSSLRVRHLPPRGFVRARIARRETAAAARPALEVVVCRVRSFVERRLLMGCGAQAASERGASSREDDRG